MTYLIGNVLRLPPCVTFDDLASAGMIGLIQAVDRFDQSRGLRFKTYAQHRIWGAMQDFLRDEDPLSRTERIPQYDALRKAHSMCKNSMVNQPSELLS